MLSTAHENGNIEGNVCDIHSEFSDTWRGRIFGLAHPPEYSTGSKGDQFWVIPFTLSTTRNIITCSSAKCARTLEKTTRQTRSSQEMPGSPIGHLQAICPSTASAVERSFKTFTGDVFNSTTLLASRQAWGHIAGGRSVRLRRDEEGVYSCIELSTTQAALYRNCYTIGEISRSRLMILEREKESHT